MRNSKFLLTSLLAAATMISVPAFADESVTWNVDSGHVYKWTGAAGGNAFGTANNWVTGTYSSGGVAFGSDTGTPSRASSKGYVLYFDSSANVSGGNTTDTSDGGGIWVTGTGNTVTACLGRWAGSIQVDAGNVLNTSWITQLKDGKIVAYGTVNITSGNLNLDGSGQRSWFVGSEGAITFGTATGLSTGTVLLSGEVDISAAEITGLVNRSLSASALREKQLVTFSAGLSSGSDRLSLGTISSIDGASATESTALTSVDSKEALTASTYYAEKTASGVKIYYLGNGYAQETLTWAGTSADHVWVNKGSNWTKDGTATSFLDNDNVVFGTDAESKTVSVESAVSVSSAAVNDDYGFAFSNGGSVSADSVTVAATKTLTLSGTGAFASKSWSGALSIASGAAISVGTSDFVGGTASVSFADASGKISVTGTDNSSSGFTDLTGVSGAGTIEFSAVGDTSDTGGNNGAYSWLSLSNNFTGTLSVTNGIVDMLTTRGTEGNTSAIEASRLGGANKIVLNGGGLLFRNVNNTTQTGMGTFDKAIEVGANGGVIRVYGNGNVTIKSDISGTGTLKHTDGGTLTLAGTVTLSGFRVGANSGTTQIAGTAQFSSVSFGATGSVLKVIGGGMLTLAGHDALSYSDTGLDTTGKIVLQGSSASSVAKLVIADNNGSGNTSMTLSKEIQLNGYAEISNASGSKFNSWNGKITASGTNNVISSVIELGKSFTVSVAESGALEISGNISDRAQGGDSGRKLIKDGLGELVLSGSNSFANGVTVSAGKLVVKSANALGASTGTTTVAADASLVVASGVTITNAGTISLSENAKLVIDLSNYASATETFTLDLVAGTALKYNEASITSANADILLDALVLDGWSQSGWTKSLAYIDSSNTLRLTMTIPEPSTFGLLAGLGALALAGTRRRRKKA